MTTDVARLNSLLQKAINRLSKGPKKNNPKPEDNSAREQ